MDNNSETSKEIMDEVAVDNPLNQSGNINVQMKLKKLFIYYCQWGDKLNTEMMSSQKFVRFVGDCRLINSQKDKTKVELIYKLGNKINKMSFPDFLNVLVKLAKWKFHFYLSNGQMNKTKALNTLIHTYLIPRHDEIYSNSELNKMMKSTSSLLSVTSKSIPISVPNVDEVVFEPKVVEVLQNVTSVLFDIYRVYFPHEMSMSQDAEFIKDSSFKNYFLFLKDFDLYPGLVTKPTSFQIYRSEEEEAVNDLIAQEKDTYLNLVKNVDLSNIIKYNQNGNILGRYFNFFKFLRILLKICETGYDNYKTNDEEANQMSSSISKRNLNNKSSISLIEKLVLTLERMELSQGFLNLEKKTNKTHSQRSSSLISPNLIAILKEDEQIINLVATHGRSHIDRLLGKNYRDICQYTEWINSNFGNPLMYIFKGFCSFGDPLNTQYMKSHIFHKLLKEAGLIISNTKCSSNIGLKINEIDSIFLKLSGDLNLSIDLDSPKHFRNSTTQNYNLNTRPEDSPEHTSKMKIHSGAKIDYSGFLIALEIISKLVFPKHKPEDAIVTLVKEYVIKNLYEHMEKLKSLEMKIEYLKENQKTNEEVAYTISLIHKSFVNVYLYYADINETINFNKFMRFASDFGIFPDLLSKCKLNTFCKGIIQSSYESNEAYENEMILGYSDFIDVLALCAYEVVFPEPEPSPVEKLLFFIEKISQSEGPEKILKNKENKSKTTKSYNLLDSFKTAFPFYFSPQSKVKDDFLEILSAEEN